MQLLGTKDLLGLDDLSVEALEAVLDTAQSMKDILYREVPKVPALQGRLVVNLFYEPSTRTRTSFERAARIMMADVTSISADASSVTKGESLKDTILTLQHLGMHTLVLRHPNSGAPQMAARIFDGAVINAGDGTHEHPTQGLLDLFTIREHKKVISGLRVAIVGDILHSRVARSTGWALARMGAEVTLAGPGTLLPVEFERPRLHVTTRLEEALEGADVVYMLRIQLERQQSGLFPSVREYRQCYGMTLERLRHAKPDAVVMHPGPINRGIEMDAALADSDRTVLLDQVTNGVAVRMAVLYLLMGREELPQIQSNRETYEPDAPRRAAVGSVAESR